MRLGSALSSILLVASPLSAQTLPPAVQAVIDRTKSTRADYAVVLTVEAGWNGRRWTERQAEFQQGPMHRVEVTGTRVLANCDTGQALVYDVAAGHLVDRPETGAGACGIDLHADRVISGRLLEPVTGAYGSADVIELTGADFVRRYAVTADGIIVESDYAPRRPDVSFSLHTLTATVSRGRQDPQMFDARSLNRSFATGLRPAVNESSAQPRSEAPPPG